ncbi:MAG: phosphatidylserine decarboxylase family protein [Planctomycetes bacterium]|nr:phosphatidylserine decarboxylase family protein [Planctomycetota bacterium]
MRIPLTVYGIPEILLFTALFGGAAAAALLGLDAPVGPVAAGLGIGSWLFIINFFRDPNRQLPDGEALIVAPADGKVTDIIQVDDVPFVDGPAIRIGIFLSVFDVHVNKSPVTGRVAYQKHRPGGYLDARDPACADLNEAHDLGLLVADGTGGTFPVLVRQIAGLVARRIVCRAKDGQELAAGERYGMIKVGSRTEVYVPVDRLAETTVKVGTMVKGGRDLIGRLRVSTPTEVPEGARS